MAENVMKQRAIVKEQTVFYLDFYPHFFTIMFLIHHGFYDLQIFYVKTRSTYPNVLKSVRKRYMNINT